MGVERRQARDGVRERRIDGTASRAERGAGRERRGADKTGRTENEKKSRKLEYDGKLNIQFSIQSASRET